MGFIVSAADRLLGAIVPRATAEAVFCPSGCSKQTCFCSGGFIFARCVKGGTQCKACTKTSTRC